MSNPSVHRPESVNPARTANIMPLWLLGLGVVLSGASNAQAPEEDAETLELDALHIEDRTAESNPYATPGAPYKAERSGDLRRRGSLAEMPGTISVLTQKQIRESGQSDLRDLVAAQPGITIGTGENGNAFGDRYIIRGQEARSDVFIDGLRDPGMSLRESFAVEQVEIAKGPASTFAGRGASGGTINSITKQASPDYRFNRIEAGIGTDARHRLTIDSNLPLAARLSVRTNLLHSEEQVPDRGPAERERRGAALSTIYTITDSLDLSVDYYGLDAEGSADLGTYIVAGGGRPVADLPVYQQNEDFLETKTDIGTLRLRYAPSNGWRIENALRQGHTDNGYLLTGARGTSRHASDPFAPGAATISLSTHQGWQDVDYLVDQINAIREIQWAGMQHEWVLGAEFAKLDVLNGVYNWSAQGTRNCVTGGGAGTANFCLLGPDGQVVADLPRLMQRSVTRGPYDSDYHIRSRALYALDRIDLSAQWRLSLGLRFDDFDYHNRLRNSSGATTDYRYSDQLWNGNIGISFEPADEGEIYLSFASASDINGGESDVGGSCGYGGLCGSPEQVASSQPETTRNLEFGSKWELFDDRLLLTGAIFEITKRDVMESVGDDYAALGTLNTGRNRVRGIEVGAVGNFTPRLSGQFGASVMDAKVTESFVSNQIGKTLSNFAERSAHLQVRFQAIDALAIGATATYTSERYAGQPDSAASFNATTGAYAYRIPSFTVFDGFAEYAFNANLSTRLQIGNVFNKDYYLAAYRSGAFTYIGDARQAQISVLASF